jgi:hypothetical protein
MRRLTVGLIMVAAVFLTAACGLNAGPTAGIPDSPGPAQKLRPANATVRDGGAGGVTVGATWVGIRDRELLFRLTLDTHSVDLSRFDVAANTRLRDASGRELQAAGWEDERRDSHHRAGTLRFPAPDNLSGQISLVVRDLAGVPERVLSFEIRT